MEKNFQDQGALALADAIKEASAVIDISVKEPVTARGRRSFHLLCEAAESLFLAQGYHQTSISQITSKAERGVGSFYTYFGDKLSIYRYILSQYSRRIRQHIAKRVSNLGLVHRREIEKQGLLAFLELVRQQPQMYHLIWESLFIDEQVFRLYYDDFSKHYQIALSKGIASGEVKDLDTEVLAYMLMGISNFVGLRYALFDKESKLEAVAETVLQVLESGLFHL